MKKSINVMMPNRRIEDSVIPFAVAASELNSGEEKFLVQGDLSESIRASLSIPILFTPVQRRLMMLVDGVVTTPVPVEALEQGGIDIKIACYVPQVSGVLHENIDMFSIFLRSRNMTADKKAFENMQKTDVVIRPELMSLGQFDYKRIDEIIASGERAAQASIPRIKKMLFDQNKF